MGTFYHTDKSAMKAVQEYQKWQGDDTLEEALECMKASYDDLDAEDRSAYDRVTKRMKENK